MNDITALGYEVPVLSAPQLRRIDSGSANQSGVYQALVVGIGTGFDVSSVLQVGGKTLCPSVGAEHVSLPSSIGRMLRQWGPSAPKPPRVFAEQNEKRYHRATQQAGMPMAVNSMTACPRSYAQKLVTVRLGGVLKLLDRVLELNPLNDFGQSVCAAELSPFLLG